MGHELAAAVIRQRPPQSIGQEMRGRTEALGDGVERDHRLRGAHLLDGRLAHEALTAVHAVAELQTDPLGHIDRVGIDRAGRPDVVHVAPADRAQHALEVLVRCGDVTPRGELGNAGVGGRHAQRGENVAAHEVVPTLSGGGRHDLARREEHDVLVAVAAAETPAGLQEADAAQDLVAVVRRRPPQPVAARKAAAVREQVPDRQLPGHVRVSKLETGEVLRDGIVPGDLAGIDEHGEGGRGERLGAGRDGEEGALGDSGGVAQAANPETARQHDGIILHHRDR